MRRKFIEYHPKFQAGGYFSNIEKLIPTNFRSNQNIQEPNTKKTVIFVPQKPDPIFLPTQPDSPERSLPRSIGSKNKFDYSPKATINKFPRFA